MFSCVTPVCFLWFEFCGDEIDLDLCLEAARLREADHEHAGETDRERSSSIDPAKINRSAARQMAPVSYSLSRARPSGWRQSENVMFSQV